MAAHSQEKVVARALSTISSLQERGASVESEIEALRSLTLEDLRRRWRTATGHVPPARLPRFLLLHLLAYRLQAQIFGDLDKTSVELLDRIGEAMTTAAGQSNGVHKSRLARSPLIVPPVAPRAIKPGAMLVREWKGVLHRVMILDAGFAWNGATYASLSTIAKVITGTEWSGPRFFGLRNPKTQQRLNERDSVAEGRRSGAPSKAASGFRRGARKTAENKGIQSKTRQSLLTGRSDGDRREPDDERHGEVTP
jgi:DUF2924 family protein